MKVTRSTNTGLPKYPSTRHFTESRALLGLATLGLSAMTGLGNPAGTDAKSGRLAGDLAVAPVCTNSTTTNIPPVSTKPTRPMGIIAVQPPPKPGELPVIPADTNRQDRIPPTVPAK